MKLITRILPILLISTLWNNSVSSQKNQQQELIEYFDTSESLDDIEGLWSLNVINTLYYHNEVIGQETEEIRSEWGIKRSDKLSFEVIDIGKASPTDNSGFDAIFESSAIEGIYTYQCNFHNPEWKAKSLVSLTNGLIIEYDYFASEKYVKNLYKKNYRPGLRLHWAFIWTKKYPTKQTIAKPNNQNSTFQGSGTGFFVDKYGYIATNYHVIEGARSVEIEMTENGVSYQYKAEIIDYDKAHDLALLKISDNRFKPLERLPYQIKSSSYDTGSDIFTLGYPMALSGMGTEIKFTDGRISSQSGFDNNESLYQITAPLQPGNSGGPLFDQYGNVIGINCAHLNPSFADNVSYSIKAKYFNQRFGRYFSGHSNYNTISNKPLTDKIKELSQYVVLIKVR